MKYKLQDNTEMKPSDKYLRQKILYIQTTNKYNSNWTISDKLCIYA